MGFVVIVVHIAVVQKFWKSVKIWLSYSELGVGTFWVTVYMLLK